jgi:hypothetical protein
VVSAPFPAFPIADRLLDLTTPICDLLILSIYSVAYLNREFLVLPSGQPLALLPSPAALDVTLPLFYAARLEALAKLFFKISKFLLAALTLVLETTNVSLFFCLILLIGIFGLLARVASGALILIFFSCWEFTRVRACWYCCPCFWTL